MSLRTTYDLVCPRCADDRRLIVEISTLAHLSAEGTEPFGDQYWGPSSVCRCPQCDYHATIASFAAADPQHEGDDETRLEVDDQQIDIVGQPNCNDDRARRAAHALRAYRDYTGDRPVSPDENVVDLLTDLRHLCDRYNVNLGRCDRVAHTAYLAEVAEVAEAKGGDR